MSIFEKRVEPRHSSDFASPYFGVSLHGYGLNFRRNLIVHVHDWEARSGVVRHLEVGLGFWESVFSYVAPRLRHDPHA